jgi:excinuclease ABC subunit C
LSGRNALAGQVTYNSRGKVKDLYKIYNISSKNSGNDIGSMQEVIERRFSKISNLSTLPSVILIDGALTHLKAVRKVLNKLKIDGVSLIAISKGARRKGEMDTVHNEQGKKLNFQIKSSELLFLQEIRNETHRFSISKQRRKELKGAAKSSLDSIELVGAERKKALLRFFGSLDQIEKASLKDLMKVRGVGKRTADIIFRNLH